MRISELKAIEKVNWGNNTKKLWLITKYGSKKDVGYRVYASSLDGNLASEILITLFSQIETMRDVVKYEPLDIDREESILSKDYEDTDFVKILEKINLGDSVEELESLDDLNVWAYAIEFKNRNERLILLNKLKTPISAKRRTSVLNVFFKNGKFSKVKEDDVIQLQTKTDMIFFNDQLFIFDRKSFELTLNIFDRMEAERDDTVEEMQNAGTISNPKNLLNLNLSKHHLRKLTKIKTNGYFADPDFIKKLEAANKKERWGLEFKSGKIVITEENLNSVLSVLNNDRLYSIINDEKFDVEVKKVIE